MTKCNCVNNEEEFFKTLDKTIDEYYDLYLNENQKLEVDRLAQESFNKNPQGDILSLRRQIIIEDYSPIQKLKTKEVSIENFYASRKDGSRIYLISQIIPNSEKDVYLGYYVPKGEVYNKDEKIESNYRVVKWLDPLVNESIYKEIKCWEELIAKGMSHPGIDLNYMLWNEKVLVMNKMDSINSEDWVKIGIDILDNLQILHQIGVHNDIKPDNIMLDPNTGKYVLLDNDAMTTKELYYGYERKGWTLDYTSQAAHVDKQITNPKYDLIELAFTLNVISNPSRFPKYMKIIMWNPSQLNNYYEYVIQLDERTRFFPNGVYDDLRKILNN